MQSVKYYNLESRSWDQVEDLEINLRKYLIDQHRILPPVSESVARPILESLVQKVGIALQEGDICGSKTYDPVISCSDFDILYQDAWEVARRIPGKKRWFRKD